jgi:hypothetical protein
MTTSVTDVPTLRCGGLYRTMSGETLLCIGMSSNGYYRLMDAAGYDDYADAKGRYNNGVQWLDPSLEMVTPSAPKSSAG